MQQPKRRLKLLLDVVVLLQLEVAASPLLQLDIVVLPQPEVAALPLPQLDVVVLLQPEVVALPLLWAKLVYFQISKPLLE